MRGKAQRRTKKDDGLFEGFCLFEFRLDYILISVGRL